MGCAYLFDYLMQAGACLHSGTGRIPLTWQELESYQQQQGIALSPFELDVIRTASNAYVYQSQLSTEPNCPPPDRVVQHDPEKLAKHIRSILR